MTSIGFCAGFEGKEGKDGNEVRTGSQCVACLSGGGIRVNAVCYVDWASMFGKW